MIKQNIQFNFRCSEELIFKLEAIAKVKGSDKAKVIRELINKTYEELF